MGRLVASTVAWHKVRVSARSRSREPGSGQRLRPSRAPLARLLCRRPTRHVLFPRRGLLALSVLGPASIVCAALVGCAAGSAPPMRQSAPTPPKGLAAVPEKLDLGVLEPTVNPVAQAAVRLLNRSGQTMSIVGWQTSCPCVRIWPAQLRLAAGEAATLEVIVDLRGEESWPGRVGVQVVGRGLDRGELVEFLVLFEVGGAEGLVGRSCELGRGMLVTRVVGGLPTGRHLARSSAVHVGGGHGWHERCRHEEVRQAHRRTVDQRVCGEWAHLAVRRGACADAEAPCRLHVVGACGGRWQRGDGVRVVGAARAFRVKQIGGGTVGFSCRFEWWLAACRVC